MSTINLSNARNYEVRGQSIWVDNGDHEFVVRIPKAAKVSLWKRTTTATVNVGGFGKITVSIIGPRAAIFELFEALTGQKVH